MEKKYWIILTLIGGTLMIVGSAVGSTAFYDFLYSIFIKYVSDDLKPVIDEFLRVISIIAAGGGYTVIAGVILAMLNLYRLGRFLISLGTSFGVLGIVVYCSYYIIQFTGIITDPTILDYLETIYGLFTFNSGFGFAGTVLAAIGKMGLKEPEEEAEEKPEVEPEEVSEDDTQVKYCPNCGEALPIHANFCNECGMDFKER